MQRTSATKAWRWQSRLPIWALEARAILFPASTEAREEQGDWYACPGAGMSAGRKQPKPEKREGLGLANANGPLISEEKQEVLSRLLLCCRLIALHNQPEPPQATHSYLLGPANRSKTIRRRLRRCLLHRQKCQISIFHRHLGEQQGLACVPDTTIVLLRARKKERNCSSFATGFHPLESSTGFWLSWNSATNRHLDLDTDLVKSAVTLATGILGNERFSGGHLERAIVEDKVVGITVSGLFDGSSDRPCSGSSHLLSPLSRKICAGFNRTSALCESEIRQWVQPGSKVGKPARWLSGRLPRRRTPMWSELATS